MNQAQPHQSRHIGPKESGMQSGVDRKDSVPGEARMVSGRRGATPSSMHLYRKHINILSTYDIQG